MTPLPAPSFALPERYSVVRHVANGGMASVWEATDELLGRSVAVKVLSPAFAADDAARRRFTREARAAARLSTHPHVVTVYDAGESDGQAYMVMALYPGGTVADRIAAGPIPRAQALDWLEDAAGALDAAHAEGVVHRDVKPANLLLDAADRVAVADFGIATAAWETSMTQTGMVLGTIAYLAPEQRTGGIATPASDRYALGLVARQLLTGAKPGQPPVTALPGAAEVVLGRATAEDPEARPPSCVALVAELEAALGDDAP
ncbi:MAG: serine/threonine protein kinase, partial [Solirubrobacterales bacterium]|nr:serine/threonine protein kinase [Solirubrobacterales bacterium]